MEERRTSDRPGGEQRPSILDHIRSNLAPDGRLRADIPPLPDHDDLPDTVRMWAPGALEGVMSWHASFGPVEPATADRIHAALLAAAQDPDDLEGRVALRAAIAGVGLRGAIGDIGKRLDAAPPPNDALFARLVRDLAFRAWHRDEVKLGLGLIGAYRDPQDAEPIRILGRHDEFTPWAASALSRIVEDPVAEWLAMASFVSGWGRVELVQRLLREPGPEVCRYLVTEGHRNHVADGYTALPVALGCRVESMLDGEPETAVIAGAGALLAALARDAVDGGPDGTLLHWPSGRAAAIRFLDLADRLAGLDDLLSLIEIERFVTAADDDPRLGEAGWDEATCATVKRRCAKLIGRPTWLDIVNAALDSADRSVRASALSAARRLELPLGERLDAFIAAEPLGAYLWSQLLNDPAADLNRVLALAPLVLREPREDDVTRIPLGPGFTRETIVSMILHRLAALPEPPPEATSTLLDALSSPRNGNRLQAIELLARWPRARWPQAVATAVTALADDPSEDIRARVAAIRP